MIKIIAGKHKGRVIATFKDADYRPSTGKFREALFSILTSGIFAERGILENAIVLDLFAGTGSLSFEAISRGACKATLVDINELYLKHAKAFAEKIGEKDNITCLKASAVSLPYSGKKYNLILMDPPYNKNLIPKALRSLVREKWLEDGAIIAAEMSKNEIIEIPDCIKILDERKYGNSKLLVMEYEQE